MKIIKTSASSRNSRPVPWLSLLFLVSIAAGVGGVWLVSYSQRPLPSVAPAPPVSPPQPSSLDPLDAELGAEGDESSQAASASDVIRERLRSLDQIRRTPEFIEYGAAPAGPYANWERNLDAALASHSLSMEEKMAAEELKALFREYVSSRGADNDVTVFFRQKVAEVSGE